MFSADVLSYNDLEIIHFFLSAVGSVAFGERLGSFDDDVTGQNEASVLSAAIAETFVCFRNCMFAFPWYQYFHTPTYKRFEKAANTMRVCVYKYIPMCVWIYQIP